MEWEVLFSKRVVKQIGVLPREAQRAVRFLAEDLRTGPTAPQWPNFSKLRRGAEGRIATIVICGEGVPLM